jgi:hypothetical protein
MNYQEGVTILVDKPYQWTSFDVVNKIRWNLKQVLKVKNIKVGHAGTLDPLATGLLVICSGKHTKRIPELMNGVKTYTGIYTAEVSAWLGFAAWRSARSSSPAAVMASAYLGCTRLSAASCGPCSSGATLYQAAMLAGSRKSTIKGPP